jgi:hypothetical protein
MRRREVPPPSAVTRCFHPAAPFSYYATIFGEEPSPLKVPFYAVGWTLAAGKPVVFTTIRLPGGEAVRVLDKRLHLTALDSAVRKLSDLLCDCGRRDRT